MCSQDVVNALREGLVVPIERADNDPCMLRLFVMQPNEMPPIERDQNALLRRRQAQDLAIRHSAVGLPHVLHGQHIMTTTAQGVDRRQREVFVGKHPGHGLGQFVVHNLLLNLVAMRAVVGPCVGKVLGAQGGITVEQLGFGRPEVPRLH